MSDNKELKKIIKKIQDKRDGEWETKERKLHFDFNYSSEGVWKIELDVDGYNKRRIAEILSQGMSVVAEAICKEAPDPIIAKKIFMDDALRPLIKEYVMLCKWPEGIWKILEDLLKELEIEFKDKD